MTIAKVFVLVLRLVSLALLLGAILSWLPNRAGSVATLTKALNRVTSPLLRPIRRVIRPIGGIDLSAVLVMVVIISVLVPAASRL